MNFTPGYIIGPSSGTRSVENGTTSPMVSCFVKDGPYLVSRQYNLFDADADASDDLGPARSLLDEYAHWASFGVLVRGCMPSEVKKFQRSGVTMTSRKSAVELVHDRLRHLRGAGHQLLVLAS